MRDRVQAARRDPQRVLLEGVHPLKHAVRFGADVELVVTPDLDALGHLLAELAPDVALPVAPTVVDATTWRALVARELPSPVLAVARRPVWHPEQVIDPGPTATGPRLVLDRPRHLGNLGAAIRVAAAAEAAGVLVVGPADPWHPTAVRAAAGLQFALPVARADQLPPTGTRPVVALDPSGPSVAWPLSVDSVILVGTERGGLAPELRQRADQVIAIPMRPGVSSLNLATAVAVVLYCAARPDPSDAHAW